MGQNASPADLILETIVRHPGRDLDELVALCPTLTWNQIFLEVDRLSRAGHVRLALVGLGRYAYALEAPADSASRMRQSPEGPARSSVLERQPQDALCGRCGGLMVTEAYEDFFGRRCILCGERIDPVILAQRQKSESASVHTVHAGV
jgi:hypothetical protein